MNLKVKMTHTCSIIRGREDEATGGMGVEAADEERFSLRIMLEKSVVSSVPRPTPVTSCKKMVRYSPITIRHFIY